MVKMNFAIETSAMQHPKSGAITKMRVIKAFIIVHLLSRAMSSNGI